jgi:hypothetical protein
MAPLSRIFNWQYDAPAQSTGHAFPANGSGGDWIQGNIIRTASQGLTPVRPRAMREPGTNVGVVTANGAF